MTKIKMINGMNKEFVEPLKSNTVLPTIDLINHTAVVPITNSTNLTYPVISNNNMIDVQSTIKISTNEVPSSILTTPEAATVVPTIMKGFVMGTIIVTAVLGNILVIISVIRHRKLRVITNYYVVSLAMADLLVALCAMTFNASVELTNGIWLFGYFMCDVYNSLDVYFSTASILHLCCISVDRYYAIVRPLQYPITMTHRTVTFMLANVWILPALISFTPIFLGWYTTKEHQEFRRTNPNVCIFVVNKYYALISSGVSFWIPGIVMVTMYYKIYKEAVRQRKALSRTSSNIVLNSIHQHRRQTHRMHYQHHLHPSDGNIELPGNPRFSISSASYGATSKTTPTMEVNINVEKRLELLKESKSYPLDCLGVSSTRNRCIETADLLEGWKLFYFGVNPALMPQELLGILTSLRLTDRLDSAERKDGSSAGTIVRQTTTSWRSEHKAARTLGIIMGAFLLCWLPFFLWYVITTLCGEKCYCPEVVVAVLFWIGYFNSALNPLIYAYFNRDFREAFKNTLECVFPCFNCWKRESPSHYV